NDQGFKHGSAGWLTTLAAFFLSILAGQGATLVGSFASVPAGAAVNLTAEGPLDWVHWGLYTETSLDRKVNVVPQISDFSLAFPHGFPGSAYQFSDNWGSYSWIDGTPNAIVADTTTGVYTVGLGRGFEFSVPAGTEVQTLKVYVGVFGASGTLQASLSDNSAP